MTGLLHAAEDREPDRDGEDREAGREQDRARGLGLTTTVDAGEDVGIDPGAIAAVITAERTKPSGRWKT